MLTLTLTLPRTSLRAQAAFSAVGNAAYLFGQGLLLVLLARCGGEIEVGRFTYGLAVTTPIFMLLNLQLRQVIGSAHERRFEWWHIVGVRLGCLALAAAAGTLIAWTYAGSFGIVMAVALLKSVDGLGEILTAWLQKANRFETTAAGATLRAVLSLSGAGLGAMLYPTAETVTLAAATGAAVSLMICEVPIFCRILRDEPTVQRIPAANAVREILRRGLPLGIAMMLVALLPNIPRYALHEAYGMEVLGIYAAVGFLPTLGTFAAGAVAQPALQRLAILYGTGRHAEYLRLVYRLIAMSLCLGLLMTAGAALVGKPSIRLVLGDTFSNHADLLVWLCVAATVAISTTPLGTACTAAGQYFLQIVVMVISASICLIASMLLVPDFGPIGAAGALIAAWLSCFAGYFFILPRKADT